MDVIVQTKGSSAPAHNLKGKVFEPEKIDTLKSASLHILQGRNVKTKNMDKSDKGL